MRCKGMSKCVRGYTRREGRLAGPDPGAAGHVRVGEATTALGEEEGLLAPIGDEGVPAFVQVAAQRPLRRLADRQQSLLRALAEHAQLLGLEVEGAEVEVDDLLAAQAAGVGEL